MDRHLSLSSFLSDSAYLTPWEIGSSLDLTPPMLRLYSVLVSLALLLVLVLFYNQSSKLRDERDALRSRAESVERQFGKVREEADKLKAELAQAKDAVAARLENKGSFEAEMDAWLLRVGDLKDFLEKNPAFSIPEMKGLKVGDWLDATRDAKLETEADFRKALAKLRTNAKNTVSAALGQALQQYLKTSGGTLPDSPRTLSTYLDANIDPAILERYSVNASGKIPGLKGDADFVLVESTQVDPLWDTAVFFGRKGGYGVRNIESPDASAVADAIKSYRERTGIAPRNFSDIEGYVQGKLKTDKARQLFDALSSSPHKGG